MRNLYKKWKHIAEIIGSFQATVIFSLFYFVLITPLGLLMSLFNDFLDIKSKPAWKKVEHPSLNLDQMKEE